jgi:hypothetical protein
LSSELDFWGINRAWGILSTPVIDARVDVYGPE